MGIMLPQKNGLLVLLSNSDVPVESWRQVCLDPCFKSILEGFLASNGIQIPWKNSFQATVWQGHVQRTLHMAPFLAKK